MSKYPECEKLLAVQDRSQPISGFLEWLNSQGAHLLRWQEMPAHAAIAVPAFRNHEHMLAEFFGIDLSLVEKERRQMLDEMRAQVEVSR